MAVSGQKPKTLTPPRLMQFVRAQDFCSKQGLKAAVQAPAMRSGLIWVMALPVVPLQRILASQSQCLSLTGI
jgi:hypothetical protein